MKTKKFLLILLLPFLLLITGCNKSELEIVSNDLNTYTMDITYNEDHTLNIKQMMKYQKEQY